ncbi:Transcriptional regulator, MarR family [Rubellimicrobium mesophilum DSM 19309]|uniref:Transcriptional regulator, MarR family n=1 Tax=Rubellimicrobium mesophilum DSM 19309 TaxID=442562 RepID=A0A017HLY2_9RHOB|nr:Transcriptional regulator, MarR family [Rubellimicrobium mesophilum DSM 19309]
MQSLGLLIHNVSHLLKREFERVARPHGLTLLQWRVLGHLSREDGLTQTVLGARLESSPMTISDVVERLEAAGLVAREVDPSDSRAKIVRITIEARGLVEKMRDVAAEVYERALDGIEEADRAAMDRALTRIASNLEDTKTRKDKVA